MKEFYSKPLLAVEMFSLTQSIARDCSDSIPKDQLNMNNINDCWWDLGGGTKVFALDRACNLDGEQMGIACYNNPTEETLIFKS